jgi:hypothetical protein
MSKRRIDLRTMVERRCSDAEFAEAQRQLRDTMAKAKGLTAEQIRLFDAATSHAYECQCPLCLEWWVIR